MTYIDAELHQVEDTLGTIVADSCVAAAVLVKGGWLPKQMRQEYMEQLRRELRKQSIQVSDSPFVLGCMVDRLQIRAWTTGREGSLPRDPSSINSMSLAHLCPMYSFIIDQEGVSAPLLADTTPPGFELCQVSAIKFTLMQLETWVHVAQEAQGKDAGLVLIITDAQAGLSDDLIAFLSAELYTRPRQESEADGIIGVGAGNKPDHPSSESQRTVQSVWIRQTERDQ